MRTDEGSDLRPHSVLNAQPTAGDAVTDHALEQGDFELEVLCQLHVGRGRSQLLVIACEQIKNDYQQTSMRRLRSQVRIR